MHSTNTVIESQVDWLTCAVHTGRAADELSHYARMLAHTSEADAERDVPFRLKGYEGWQRGRVRFGARSGAALIQLSGDLAARELDTLEPIADSISRVDIACTVRMGQRDNGVGEAAYYWASQWYHDHPNAARPEAHRDADGGYTCYVGKRSSDMFLRIYNKEAESADDADLAARYERCWRYELEVKGGTARKLAAALVETEGDQRAADVQAMLHEYVSRHGMEPAFPHSGGRALVKGFRRRSDRESKLAWLDKSVRPAVAWLASTGDPSDIYKALGLNESRSTRSRSIDTTTGELRDEPN